jgi:polyisoprenoid-binding protein YceI
MTKLLSRVAAPFAALLLVTAAAHAQPARYQIDPEHFSVGFLVDHLGYAKVLGLFRESSGAYAFDEKTGALSDVRLVIDARSVYTGHTRRDRHLASPDFLNAAEFREIVFTGASAKRTGERTFVVDGQLEMLGKTQPLTLNVTWNKSGKYELPGADAYVMGVSARGSFKRSAFGMNYGLANGWVGDTVELIVEFEAKRK